MSIFRHFPTPSRINEAYAGINEIDRRNGMTRGRKLGRAVITLMTAGAISVPAAYGVEAATSGIKSAASVVEDGVDRAFPDKIAVPGEMDHHKELTVGSTYIEPSGSKILVRDIVSAAQATGIGEGNVQPMVSMLSNEVQAQGLEAGNLQPGTVLRVPVQSQVGTEVIPLDTKAR